MNPSFHDVIAARNAERRDLFLGAAARLGTAVQNVEKDCWTLDALFNGLAVGGPRLLFKGGISRGPCLTWVLRVPAATGIQGGATWRNDRRGRPLVSQHQDVLGVWPQT